MKKLGIFGGMGPLCTAIFYEKLVKFTKASKDQDHIPTIILSDPQIPDRTDVILNDGDKDLLIKKAKEDLETLESLRVERIAIPCNTMHYFYDDLQKLTDVKIINMIEATVGYLKDQGYEKIAVLGTYATMNCGLYEKYAEPLGIELVKIADEDQKIIRDAIYQIKETGFTEAPKVIDLAKGLETSVDAVILACTELPLIDGIADLNFIIDPMDILAETAIRELGYKVKE